MHYDINAFQSHSSQRANRQSSESSRRLVDTFFFNKGMGVTLVDLSRKIFDEVVASFDDPKAQDTFVASLKKDIKIYPDMVFLDPTKMTAIRQRYGTRYSLRSRVANVNGE